MGNWFSDKYAEGTVGRRFYAGCQNVDTVEALAAEHARELFGAPHAYVQPHSGIDANLVAFWAVLAQRVEVPALEKAGVRHVNDLTDADWADAAPRPRQPADARHVPGRRRPPHPRLPAEHLRQDVRPALLRHRPGHRPDRLRRRPRPGPRVQAADHRRRLLRLPPAGELRRSCARSPTRSAPRFMVDMAHFAGLVAGKVLTGDFDPVPHAHIVTTTTHKSLRGPRGGMVLAQPEFADAVDRGCPMVLGGPLPHVMAAKAVAFAEARQPAFADYAQAVVDNARALAEGLTRRGARAGHRRHRQPPGADRRHRASASPAARPSPRCSTPASSPTATPSRPTRTAPGTPPASASAPRR